MLSWFDQNPERAWWLSCVVLAVIVYVGLRPLVRGSVAGTNVRSDWRWGFAIFALLLVGRWPTFFVTRELNGDESQLLAGALTLRHDPLFWRSVDGGTAGPADFYALLPMGSILGGDTYLSARCTALLLLTGALLFTHQTLALCFGRQVARMAGLGALALEAFILHQDFRHYSTELVPIFLLAVAGWVLARWFAHGAKSLALAAVVGVVLGLVPLAKLQAAPFGAVMGGAALAGVWITRKNRTARESWLHSAVLVMSALTPVIFFGVLLVVTGEWENAITPYLRHNLNYIGASYFTFGEWWSTLQIVVGANGRMLFWWLGGAGVTVVALAPDVVRSPKKIRWLAAVGVIFVLTSAACVLAPWRPFTHYFQFMVVPIIGLLGVVLASAYHEGLSANQRGWRLGLCLSATLVAPLAQRAMLFDPHVGNLVQYQEHPVGPIAQLILKYTEPGDAMALWGWPTFPYAETHLRQATRDAHSQAEIIAHPYYDYFRARYLSDFTKNSPSVFIDTTGLPGYPFAKFEIGFDRLFPELTALVRQNYTLAGNVDGARIFIRNDRYHRVQP